MKPITLEEIDKKKKNIAQSLDQLNLEKRKVDRAEKEMFELHRQSLKPLRQILTLPISSKDYQVYNKPHMDWIFLCKSGNSYEVLFFFDNRYTVDFQ